MTTTTTAQLEFITEAELADLLRQKVSTVQRWRRLGCVPPYLLVTREVALYRREDVTRWLSSRLVVPTPKPRAKKAEEPAAQVAA